MPPQRLQGIIAPLPTPFDATSDTPWREGLSRIAHHLVLAGIHGVVTAGSTGEGELLSDDERTRMVQWLRPLVPATAWLIAGTGAESTRGAMRATRAAADVGADAVLVRPPAYFSAILSPNAFADHYLRLADVSPIPIIVYNIPKFAHVSLAPEVLSAVSAHQNVIGFKDSSGDFELFNSYRAAAPRLAAFVGSGLLIQRALQHGAAGGVLAVACFAASTCLALYRAQQTRDPATAEEMQRRLDPLAREIVGKLGPAGIKVAMEAVGLPSGDPRAPLTPLSPEQRETVASLMGALVAAT